MSSKLDWQVTGSGWKAGKWEIKPGCGYYPWSLFAGGFEVQSFITISEAKNHADATHEGEFIGVSKSSDPCLGMGGAPTRATTLPTSAEERKKYPIASGFMDYFPDAVAAVANLSYKGNEQHNNGKPLHWDRSKSGDEADTLLRHFLQRGTLDTDGVRHSTKLAWRALALLQKELESGMIHAKDKA